MDETRQLLKIFGVAVTDFESEAEKLASVAAEFSSETDRDEIGCLRDPLRPPRRSRESGVGDLDCQCIA